MHFFQSNQSLLAVLKCFSLFSSEVRLVVAHSSRAGSGDTADQVVDNNRADQEVDSIPAAGFVVPAIVPGFDRTLAVVAAIVLDLDRKSAAAEPEAAATVVPGWDRTAAGLSQSAVVEVAGHCFRSIFCTRNSSRGTATAGRGNHPCLGRVTQ